MKISNKILVIRKFIHNLDNNLQSVYPLTESKKVLLLSLEKSRIAVSECINLALIIESNRGLIKPSKSKKKNLESFFNICCKDIGITNKEIEKIKEILLISKDLRESSMNFKRKEDIIILSEELNYKKINLKRLEEYKNFVQILLEKIILMNKLDYSLNKNLN